MCVCLPFCRHLYVSETVNSTPYAMHHKTETNHDTYIISKEHEDGNQGVVDGDGVQGSDMIVTLESVHAVICTYLKEFNSIIFGCG